MTTGTGVQLGDTVDYRDRYGRAKAAIVTATHESMNGVSDVLVNLGAPATGHAHLTVLSFTGSVYTKHDVPCGDGPGTWSARTP
jgi:hypothetical protein